MSELKPDDVRLRHALDDIDDARDDLARYHRTWLAGGVGLGALVTAFVIGFASGGNTAAAAALIIGGLFGGLAVITVGVIRLLTQHMECSFDEHPRRKLRTAERRHRDLLMQLNGDAR